VGHDREVVDSITAQAAGEVFFGDPLKGVGPMVKGHQILPGSRNQSPDARAKPA
jgi:hypothetical protein